MMIQDICTRASPITPQHLKQNLLFFSILHLYRLEWTLRNASRNPVVVRHRLVETYEVYPQEKKSARVKFIPQNSLQDVHKQIKVTTKAHKQRYKFTHNAISIIVISQSLKTFWENLRSLYCQRMLCSMQFHHDPDNIHQLLYKVGGTTLGRVRYSLQYHCLTLEISVT